ncbi:MAG: penicillin-binding protein [Chitinophagaceae bacterium]|nr:MAG: penicillin-binding protein [Chitinophagaceae bacterium]
MLTKQKLFKFIGIGTFLFILLFILSVTALYFSVKWGAFGQIPDKEILADIRHQTASRVYSTDRKLMGVYFAENRTNTRLEQINPQFIEALLAIEDIRFYEHNGVDRRSLMRVLVRSILLRQDAGGGSTLTQQLAKNLYPRQSASRLGLVISKFREIIIAKKLESIYSKEEILELYLNTVTFGEETFGLEAGSRRFFNTTPANLTLTQSATLAGMLKGTTSHNPRLYPERAKTRRNLVISQMKKYDYISAEKAEKAREQPLGLMYRSDTHTEGIAPYFRQHLRSELQKLLESTPALDGNIYNLYTDGLKIVTTIDSRLQKAADKAVKKHLTTLQKQFDLHWTSSDLFIQNKVLLDRMWKVSEHYEKLTEKGLSEEKINQIRHTKTPMLIHTHEGMVEKELSPDDSIRHYLSFLHAGFFAIDANDGAVRAWTGGSNYRFFQYDHVKSKRQTGSAFKPFVYAAALQNGVQPCDYYRNVQTVYEAYQGWRPQNISNEYGGRYSVQASLAKSINTIAVELLMQNGFKPVEDLVRQAGITSDIPAKPSLALGANSANLLEMVQAYSVFASEGKALTPYYIESIYNSDGQLIYDFSNHSEEKYVLETEIAQTMTKMLQKVVDEGTANALRNRFQLSGDIAGKTGTSQNNADGWFVGYTPELVFGSWVGGSLPFIRFRSSSLGSGSRTALPICGYFLQDLANHPEYNNKSIFFSGNEYIGLNTDCEAYREERFVDRFRDFFRGDSERTERRELEEEKPRRRLIDRIRGR